MLGQRLHEFGERGYAASPGGFQSGERRRVGDVCGLRLDNSVECWGNYDLGNYDSAASTYLLPPGGSSSRFPWEWVIMLAVCARAGSRVLEQAISRAS